MKIIRTDFLMKGAKGTLLEIHYAWWSDLLRRFRYLTDLWRLHNSNIWKEKICCDVIAAVLVWYLTMERQQCLWPGYSSGCVILLLFHQMNIAADHMMITYFTYNSIHHCYIHNSTPVLWMGSPCRSDDIQMDASAPCHHVGNVVHTLDTMGLVSNPKDLKTRPVDRRVLGNSRSGNPAGIFSYCQRFQFLDSNFSSLE